MSGVHVRATYHTDPEDPNGECLFRLEVWPLPQEVVPGLSVLLDAAAKDYLRRMNIAGAGETDLTAKGSMQ